MPRYACEKTRDEPGSSSTGMPHGKCSLPACMPVDIVHPDEATGVIYKAGEQVATLTTDENGEASL